MNMAASRASTLQIVRTVLAADCACQESALTEQGLTVTHAEERAGRRRFPPPGKPLYAVTMGAGVVVSTHPQRIAWLRATLGERPRDAIFSAATIGELARYVARDRQELCGPNATYVCAPDTFRSPAAPDGVTITLHEGDAVADLYRHEGFGHALAYRRNELRPDVAAAVASQAGMIVGIAAASADCDALWQIGIDVVPAARGAGIGRALVGRLTALIFDRGRIPYYATAVSNLRSASVALSLGYFPAWTDLYVKDLPADTEG
jgi:GNAT superfamily N-acetyltransferase